MNADNTGTVLMLHPNSDASFPGLREDSSRAGVSGSTTGLLDDDIEQPESVQANLGAFVPSTLADVADPLSLSREVGQFLLRQSEANLAAGADESPMAGMEPFGGVKQPAVQLPMLSPEEATKQFGISGPNGLTFKSPITAMAARDLNEEKQHELALADARARRTAGTWNSLAALGVNFVANAIDPLNIAASFVPLVGEERTAAWMAEAGSSIFGRAVVRGAIGAAQGAAAQLPLSALRYGLSRADQSDYTAADVLGDVAMGAFMGGAIHAGSGLTRDLLRGVSRRAVRAATKAATEAAPKVEAPGIEPTATMAEAADSLADAITSGFEAEPESAVVAEDPEVGAAASRTAISQVVQGDPVEVEPVLAAPQESGVEPRVSSGYATTPSGKRVPVSYEIADLDTLEHASGELQPRERERASSQQQISNMAANLDPGQLTEGVGVGVGAPIVGPDNIVESGNGRVAAIRMAAEKYPDRYQAYVEALKGLGYDTDGTGHPVLIRRRTGTMSPEERRAFVIDSNRSPVMRMAAGEQAKADAAALDRDSLTQFNPALSGGVLAAGNRDFVRGWIAKLPATERNALLDPSGGLSAEGVRRLQAALFARAYGDTGQLTKAFESASDDAKTISGALLDASPAWAAMRTDAADGTIPKSFDITDKLLRAIDLWRTARDRGERFDSVLAQVDAFDPIDPQTALLFRALMNKGMTRLSARPKIAEALVRYASEARRQTGGDLLGASESVTPERALDAIINTKQTDLFNKAAARAEGQPSQRELATSAAADVAEKQADLPPVAAPKPEAVEAKPTGPLSSPEDAAELAKLAPEQQTVLRGLYQRAAEEKPAFDETLRRIAQSIGGDAMLAPLKGAKRAIAKIAADYEGDASKIKDILRATIEVPSEAKGKQALRELGKSVKVLPGGRRAFKPDATGYSDMKVNVELPGGLTGEAQFNTPEMLRAKEELHVHYEREAAIRRASTGRKLTPEENAEIERGREAMRQGYAEARRLASKRLRSSRAVTTKRSNSALETSTPLRSTESNGNQRPSGTSQAVASNLPASRVTGTPSTSKYSVFTGSSSLEDAINVASQPTPRQAQNVDLLGRKIAQPVVQKAQETRELFLSAAKQGLLTDTDAADVKAALDAAKAHDASAKAAQTAADCLQGGLL